MGSEVVGSGREDYRFDVARDERHIRVKRGRSWTRRVDVKHLLAASVVLRDSQNYELRAAIAKPNVYPLVDKQGHFNYIHGLSLARFMGVSVPASRERELPNECYLQVYTYEVDTDRLATWRIKTAGAKARRAGRFGTSWRELEAIRRLLFLMLAKRLPALQKVVPRETGGRSARKLLDRNWCCAVRRHRDGSLRPTVGDDSQIGCGTRPCGDGPDVHRRRIHPVVSMDACTAAKAKS